MDERYGLPPNTEEASEDSDLEAESTTWGLLSVGADNELGVRRSDVAEQKQLERKTKILRHAPKADPSKQNPRTQRRHRERERKKVDAAQVYRSKLKSKAHSLPHQPLLDHSIFQYFKPKSPPPPESDPDEVIVVEEEEIVIVDEEDDEIIIQSESQEKGKERAQDMSGEEAEIESDDEMRSDDEGEDGADGSEWEEWEEAEGLEDEEARLYVGGMNEKEGGDAELLELVLDEVLCSANGETEVQGTKMSLHTMRAELQNQLKKKSIHLLPAIRDQLTWISSYTNLLIKGNRKMEASMKVAEMFHDGSGLNLAKRVRSLFHHYRNFGGLPVEARGGKRSGRSFLDDEGVFAAARAWLTAQPKGEVTPLKFSKALNSDILPRVGVNFAPGKEIGEKTACRWLVRLGFHLSEAKKGLYVDGHEREDVIKYRQDVFLPLMEKYDRLSTHYELDGDNLVAREPELLPGEKRHVILWHDESCMHGYDYKTKVWLDQTQQLIPKKSKGKLIHVSDFITQEGSGRLVVTGPDGSILRDARKIIYPGAGAAAWWNTEQLLAQVKEAISIFEEAHPGCTAVFVFDQSSAHASHGEGALNAFGMNKKDGGKVGIANDTVFPPECSREKEFLVGTKQPMWVQSDTGERVAKGLDRVLQERGCHPGGRTKAKCSPRCSDSNTSCCLARILSRHQDFREQKSALETLILRHGHVCVFLPKFHCELNPIEMYWGYIKFRYRQIEKKSFEDAKKVAVQCLDSCPVDTIRRFANRTFRFMDAYRKGLGIKAATWVVKKQKSHRKVSEAAMRLWKK